MSLDFLVAPNPRGLWRRFSLAAEHEYYLQLS